MKKDEVVSYYDSIADKYDADRFGNTYGKFIDREERILLDKLGVRGSGDVLEIACGTGRLLDYATKGLDASENMLSVAKKSHPTIPLTVGDASNTGFAPASFDTIYSFHLMMHLSVDTIQGIMREAHRILRPGGRLIFDIPSLQRRSLLSKKQPTWHGRTSLTPAMVKEMADGMFDVKSVHGIMMLPIHKFPASKRMSMISLDRALCASPLRNLSSYLLFELVKK